MLRQSNRRCTLLARRAPVRRARCAVSDRLLGHDPGSRGALARRPIEQGLMKKSPGGGRSTGYELAGRL